MGSSAATNVGGSMISRVLGKLFLSKINYCFSRLRKVFGLKVELRKSYRLVAIEVYAKDDLFFSKYIVESSLLYHAL